MQVLEANKKIVCVTVRFEFSVFKNKLQSQKWRVLRTLETETNNFFLSFFSTIIYRYAIGNAQRPMVKIGWLDILANDTQEHYFPNNTGGGPSIKVSQRKNNPTKISMVVFDYLKKKCFCVYLCDFMDVVDRIVLITILKEQLIVL